MKLEEHLPRLRLAMNLNTVLRRKWSCDRSKTILPCLIHSWTTLTSIVVAIEDFIHAGHKIVVSWHHFFNGQNINLVFIIRLHPGWRSAEGLILPLLLLISLLTGTTLSGEEHHNLKRGSYFAEGCRRRINIGPHDGHASLKMTVNEHPGTS